MTLSRRERFDLKSRMMEAVENPQEWSFQRTNLLLVEFGCQPLDPYDRNNEFTFADSIATVSDADLVEMFSVISGENEDQIASDIQDTQSSIWKPGYVRVFLSHSASHKQFVGEVADHLAVSGIHAFVAHDTMEVEQPWQDQIESALRSMQALVAFIHPEFGSSAWCQQEVGWALGRGIPKYVLRSPQDPAGFIGRTQWPQVHQQSARQVAQQILGWIGNNEVMSTQIVDGLLAALREANNYMDAGATASRIATIEGLTSDQWESLSTIYWQNDQVARAGLVARALAPYYQAHGKIWPPERHLEADPF